MIDWEAKWEARKQRAIKFLRDEYAQDFSNFLTNKQSLINKYGVDILSKIPGFLEDRPVKIVSELGINVKHAGYFALLPANLDRPALEAHIQRVPLTNYFFVQDGYGRIRTVNKNNKELAYYDIERMIHIIGLITSARADNKDEVDENAYVLIFAERMRNYFKDYLSYLDYLIQTGIIICDRQYIPDEKPRGYKLAPEYENVPLIPCYYSYFNQIPVNPIEEEVHNKETDSPERNTLLDKPYLNYWYYQKKINIWHNADVWAYRVMRNKTNLGELHWDISDVWDKEKHRYKRKNPKLQYDAAIQNLNELKIHHYKAKIDTNVHRLNSVITNIEKEYRNFFTYDGQEMVAIDIKNSQPYLFCLLLNKEFWMDNSPLPININTLPLNIQALFKNPPEILSNIRSFLESVNIADFQEYIELVANGQLYEMIVDRDKQRNRTSKITRKIAKKELLILFYSANREDIEEDTRKIYRVERIFNEKFPIIMRLIRLIKMNYDEADINNNYNRFARLLQSIEVEIVLNKCCQTIWDGGNHQVPIFTIHDSIATTFEYQDYVRHVMEYELTKAIQVKPTLQIESWHISNLHDYPFPKLPAVI